MHNPRVIRATTRKIQTFFEVQTTKRVKDLNTNQVDFCIENKTSLLMKLTRVEYMKKIGFVEGINYRIALTKQYKEYLEIIGDIEEGVIEIKKEWVYQQGYRSKVLVVYSVLSQSEKVDYQLMNNSLQDSDYTKYVSFKNIDPKVQLGMLYLNNLVKVKRKI